MYAGMYEEKVRNPRCFYIYNKITNNSNYEYQIYCLNARSNY